jgi:hypothetical protein
VAWFDAQSFGRVLVELTQDNELGEGWNELAMQAARHLLFGDNL